MNWITPFAYSDEQGRLHFFPEKILEAVGLPATRENLDFAMEALLQNCREMWPETTVLVLLDDEPGSQPVSPEEWRMISQTTN